MDAIAIFFGAIFMIFLCFAFGYMMGYTKGNNEKYEGNDIQDLYCFQCEIEMPVKEKDGRLHCSNCGFISW